MMNADERGPEPELVVKDKVADMGLKTAEEFYWEIHKEIEELHKTKGADVGKPEDPLANLRASADYGVEPWVHCMIQCEENLRRIQTFLRRGNLKDKECQIENAMLDNSNYSMLALALYREVNQGKMPPYPDPLEGVVEDGEDGEIGGRGNRDRPQARQTPGPDEMYGFVEPAPQAEPQSIAPELPTKFDPDPDPDWEDD